MNNNNNDENNNNENNNIEAYINPATDDYGRYLTGEPAKSIEVWRGGKRLFKIVDIESVSAGREIKRMLEGCGVKVIPE